VWDLRQKAVKIKKNISSQFGRIASDVDYT
jgi:hypothetical protein